MPKVSVIMGVYNCKNEDALYRSVRSIIDQNFWDWEFLICDDGSTDETPDILRKVKELDDRIQIIGYKNNRGLGYALNYCLKFVQGEYIARMDDDDISHKDRFERQVRFLDENKNIAIVGSIANVFNEEGYWGVLRMPETITKDDFLWNIPYIHPSAMFRKKALLDVNGYKTDSVNRRCEDYTLIMELYSKGYRGCNIQEPLLDYFIANGDTKYRKMRDRVAEAIVRYKGYRLNGILLKGLPYIMKPILVGLIPQSIFREIKKIQYKKR